MNRISKYYQDNTDKLKKLVEDWENSDIIHKYANTSVFVEDVEIDVDDEGLIIRYSAKVYEDGGNYQYFNDCEVPLKELLKASMLINA